MPRAHEACARELAESSPDGLRRVLDLALTLHVSRGLRRTAYSHAEGNENLAVEIIADNKPTLLQNCGLDVVLAATYGQGVT
jgi:hypothetical protein